MFKPAPKIKTVVKEPIPEHVTVNVTNTIEQPIDWYGWVYRAAVILALGFLVVDRIFHWA